MVCLSIHDGWCVYSAVLDGWCVYLGLHDGWCVHSSVHDAWCVCLDVHDGWCINFGVHDGWCVHSGVVSENVQMNWFLQQAVTWTSCVQQNGMTLFFKFKRVQVKLKKCKNELVVTTVDQKKSGQFDKDKYFFKFYQHRAKI